MFIRDPVKGWPNINAPSFMGAEPNPYLRFAEVGDNKLFTFDSLNMMLRVSAVLDSRSYLDHLRLIEMPLTGMMVSGRDLMFNSMNSCPFLIPIND